MSEQKPRIGQKGGAKEIAKKLSEIRRKPISKEILDIVDEISKKTKRTKRKSLNQRTRRFNEATLGVQRA